VATIVDMAKQRPLSPRPKRPGRPKVAVEATDPVGEAIGSKLRALYDEVASEPVPDRFMALLKRLESDGPGSDSSQDPS
jgi:hypothetical protein